MLGLCTQLLLEASEAYRGTVFAIDRWDAAYLLEHQYDQYARDPEALGMLRSSSDVCAAAGDAV